MKPAATPERAGARFERGIAAVELAIILGSMFFLIPAVLLFGRLLYQYNVIEQAAHDAARYMASVPRADIQSTASAGAQAAVAEQMIRTTVAAAGVAPDTGLGIAVLCNDFEPCGSGVVNTIVVRVIYTLDDRNFFNGLTSQWTGDGLVTFRARSIVPYVN